MADHRYIVLAGGARAIVDSADHAELSKFKWHLSHGYAARRSSMKDGKRRNIVMQNQIMQPPPSMVVDHINHDRLDNRRSNLRIATRNQNRANSFRRPGGQSKFKGVIKHRNRWQAQITINRARVPLGYFIEEADAARRYDAAAREAFGQFARLNFPRDGERSGLR